MSFPSGRGFHRFKEWSAVRDQCDVTLEDHEFLSEVELATKLIIAATGFDGPMSLEIIDRILEVQRDAASTDLGT
jgi:hypothetical protein